MSELAQRVREDIARCVDGERSSPRQVVSTVLAAPGLQAVLVYRLGQALPEMSARKRFWPIVALGAPFYGIAALAVRWCYGISLSPRARIGPGFHVHHFGGVS